jgi:hypothetical protein
VDDVGEADQVEEEELRKQEVGEILRGGHGADYNRGRERRKDVKKKAVKQKAV